MGSSLEQHSPYKKRRFKTNIKVGGQARAREFSTPWSLSVTVAAQFMGQPGLVNRATTKIRGREASKMPKDKQPRMENRRQK